MNDLREVPEDPRLGLRQKTLSGLGWSFSSTALTTVIQLGHMVVMARLLAPADFGLVALATAFLRFGTYFAQMGVGQALIQRPTLSQREIRTAFTSSLLLGGVLAGAFLVAAPFAEAVAGDPEVIPVIQVLALSMLISGSGVTAFSLLKRELHFRALAGLEVGSYVMGYVVVGLTMALMGYGVWSLVFASLCQALLQTLSAYALSRHTLRPLLGWNEVKSLYGYGARFSGTQFLNVVRHAMVTATVGRVAGMATLGLFDRARLLVQLPFERVEATVTKVAFPAVSRVQGETDLLGRIYLVQAGLIAGLFLPTLAGMALSADVLVGVLLGSQWGEAARIVPWFAVAVGLIFIAHFSLVMSDALALMNQRLAIEGAQTMVLVVALLAGARLFGFHGILAAIVLSELLGYVGYTRLIMGRLGVTWWDYGRAVWPGLVATCLVSGALLASREALRSGSAPAALAFLVQLSLGASVLIGLWWLGPFRKLRSQFMAMALGKGRVG